MTRNTIAGITLPGLALAGLLVLPATAHAQSQTASSSDTSYLKDQAQGTAYELAIARLATQKAEHPDVKTYAQNVVSDHDKLNEQLKMVARIKNVDLPTDMTAKQKAELAKLQGLTGAAFDKAYIEETTRINSEDKTQDAKEVGATTDQTVKQFAEQVQAADQKHQKAGEALAKRN